MDYFLFKIINNFAASSLFTRSLAIFAATYAIFLLPAGVLFLGKQWKRALATSIVGAGITYGINALIGLLYFRARPFVDHPVIQLIHQDADKSFPSDHTAIAFAIATVLFFFNKRIGYCAWSIAFLIGAGRIAVGVHYPLDVIAGMFIGSVVGYCTYRFFVSRRI